MKLHEYQAKQILLKYGVPVQNGIPIKEISEFDAAISTLQSHGINQYVVKSQIHAGGRGKGKVYNPNNREELILDGGVKFTTDAAKAREYAEKILGNLLVTHQTGEEGKIVQTLFITEGLDYTHEFYIGILLDRSVAGKGPLTRRGIGQAADQRQHLRRQQRGTQALQRACADQLPRRLRRGTAQRRQAEQGHAAAKGTQRPQPLTQPGTGHQGRAEHQAERRHTPLQLTGRGLQAQPDRRQRDADREEVEGDQKGSG